MSHHLPNINEKNQGLVLQGINFILSHFQHQLHVFPRSILISEDKIVRKFSITSKEEIFSKCLLANYIDCRINAYPEFTTFKGIVRHPPNLIFIDLDLKDFGHDKTRLDKVLEFTLEKIDDKLDGYPTVLWTGNGYHIYLPINSVVFEQYDIFSQENFPNLRKYNNKTISELFLRFTESYFTEGMADLNHNVTFRSALLRIPNTYNGKCLLAGFNSEKSKIKIMKEWNKYLPPVQYITIDFLIWLNNLELRERNNAAKYMAVSNTLSKGKKIGWIEKLLQTPLEDNRKNVLFRILCPYAVNVLGLKYDDAINLIRSWLDICNDKKKLDFNPNEKLRNNLNSLYRSNIKYYPIGKEKLKEQLPYVFHLMNSK